MITGGLRKQSSFYVENPSMYKSCKYCGKIHPVNYQCTSKPKRAGRYDYTDRDVWKFRHGQQWKDKAEEIKERDNWMCLCCLSQKKIVTVNLEVHHIVPLVEDMELKLEDDNLITLCRSCHEQAEKGQITRAELKEMVQSHVAPRAKDTPVL